MCRMFLTTPNIKAPLEDINLYLQQLYMSQGGGGSGIGIFDSDNGKFRVMKSRLWDTRNGNLLESMMGAIRISKHPFMVHMRGPLGSSYKNHPHYPEGILHKAISISERLQGDDIPEHHNESEVWDEMSGFVYTEGIEELLVHNGDTAPGYMSTLLSMVVEHMMSRVPEIPKNITRYMSFIDTELLAYAVSNIGVDALSKIHNGSFIYGYVENGEPKYIIKRDKCYLPEDYTKLYFVRWDDITWMVTSEVFMNNVLFSGAKIYHIPHGVYEMEEILSEKGLERVV